MTTPRSEAIENLNQLTLRDGGRIIFHTPVDRSQLPEHDDTPNEYAVAVYPEHKPDGGCIIYGWYESRQEWIPNISARWLVMHLLSHAALPSDPPVSVGVSLKFCRACGQTTHTRTSKYCGDGSDKDNEHRWEPLGSLTEFDIKTIWNNALRVALAGEWQVEVYPISKGLGPNDQPKCPGCGNSLQNGTPHGSPHLRRCASCKLIFQAFSPASQSPPAPPAQEEQP